MRIEWKNLLKNISKTINKIIKPVLLIEMILTIIIIFQLCIKIKNQKAIIEKQSKKIKECSYEIKRLKLIEQDFEEEKEYLYECYKDIESKTERSGK